MQTEYLHKIIREQVPSFRQRPYLANLAEFKEQIRNKTIVNYLKGDYCWSLCFDPPFVANLCFEGFLPICCDVGGSEVPGLHVLLPKLHEMRCVLRPGRVHISRNVRKRAKRYILTACRDFQAVLQGCIAQHEASWLYPPMQRLLLQLNKGFNLDDHCTSDSDPAGDTAVSVKRFVRTVSFELWALPEKEESQNSSAHDEMKEFHLDSSVALPEGSRLVAGDLGFVVGRNYTSCSGFYADSGAGSMQLALSARLMERFGALWDLGQDHVYKTELGAELIPRADFLSQFRSLREGPPLSFFTRGTAYKGADLIKSDD